MIRKHWRKCVVCRKRFAGSGRENVCSPKCRVIRTIQMRDTYEARRVARSHKDRCELTRGVPPEDMAILLPANPSDPFLTDTERAMIAASRVKHE